MFETQHPYLRQDARQAKTVKVSGAIGYIVELDKRCSVETQYDYLLLRSEETNTQYGANVGTEFKIERSPISEYEYILFGKQLEIVFVSMNPRRGGYGNRGGRGAGAAAVRGQEDSHRRWGFKLTVKPIFGTPRILGEDSHKTLALNELVQLTNKLTVTLTEAKFIRSGNERIADISEVSRILNWHLFKGGIKVSALEGVTDTEQILQ